MVFEEKMVKEKMKHILKEKMIIYIVQMVKKNIL